MNRKSANSFSPAPGNRLIGYKVMRWDPVSRQLVSGANSRLRLDLHKGARHAMPGVGIFLGSTRQYVLDHYAVHDLNALITYSFDPRDLQSGSLDDREPEISVSSAKVEAFEVLDEDLNAVRIARIARETFTRLAVFDFDGTLFRSQEDPPKWWPVADDFSWGSDPVSLSSPCVPNHPGSEYWISETLGEARKARARSDTLVVIVTGRIRALKPRMAELLLQQGLDPHRLYFNPGMPAATYKERVFSSIFASYSGIDTVEIWENENTGRYKGFFQKMSEVLDHPIHLEVTKVDKPAVPVSCSLESVQRIAALYATKDEYEHEEDQSEDMVKPLPKQKPPRQDLRKQKIQEKDEDVGKVTVEKDPDLSLNYKKVAARLARLFLVEAKHKHTEPKKKQGPTPPRAAPAPAQPPAMQPVSKPEPASKFQHKPGEVWQTAAGYAAKNMDGVSKGGFKEKEQAEAYAKGKGKETPDQEEPVTDPEAPTEGEPAKGGPAKDEPAEDEPDPKVDDLADALEGGSQSAIDRALDKLTESHPDQVKSLDLGHVQALTQDVIDANQALGKAEGKDGYAEAQAKAQAAGKAQAEAIADIRKQFSAPKADPAPNKGTDPATAPAAESHEDSAEGGSAADQIVRSVGTLDRALDMLSKPGYWGSVADNVRDSLAGWKKDATPEQKTAVEDSYNTTIKSLMDSSVGTNGKIDRKKLEQARSDLGAFGSPEDISKLPQDPAEMGKFLAVAQVADNIEEVSKKIEKRQEQVTGRTVSSLESKLKDTMPDGFSDEDRAMVGELLSDLDGPELETFQTDLLDAVKEGKKDWVKDGELTPEAIKSATKALKAKTIKSGPRAALQLADRILARQVAGNPSNLGGTPVSDTEKDASQLRERSEQALQAYSKMTPELRQVHVDALAKLVGTSDPESPRGKELSSIVDGLAAVAASRGESLKPTGAEEPLRPEPSPAVKQMAKVLSRGGNLKAILRPPSEFGHPEVRQALSSSVDTMNDTELAGIFKDEEKSPYAGLADLLSGEYDDDDYDIDPETQAFLRHVLKTVFLNKATSQAAFMSDVSSVRSEGKAPVTPEDQAAVIAEADAATSKGISECMAIEDPVKRDECIKGLSVSMSQNLLDAAENHDIQLPQDSPVVRQIQQVAETGDAGELDKVYRREEDAPKPIPGSRKRKTWFRSLSNTPENEEAA